MNARQLLDLLSLLTPEQLESIPVKVFNWNLEEYTEVNAAAMHDGELRIVPE